jgi:hypothetical protein
VIALPQFTTLNDQLFMAALDTTCPQCAAPHAKKLSLIYSEGISTVNLASQSVGKTNTVIQVKTTTEGTSTGIQQSHASRAAAPPPMPVLRTSGMTARVFVGIGGFLAAFAISIFAMMSGFGFFASLGLALVLMILAIVSFYKVDVSPTPEEQREYDEATQIERAALEAWEQTFSCGSCGHRFMPNA